MRPTIVRFSWLLSLFFSISSVQAQIEKGKLVKGELVKSEIGSDAKHHHSINFKKDQFAFLKLMQKGIDL